MTDNDITERLARIRGLYEDAWSQLPEWYWFKYDGERSIFLEAHAAIAEHIAKQDKRIAELEEDYQREHDHSIDLHAQLEQARELAEAIGAHPTEGRWDGWEIQQLVKLCALLSRPAEEES